MDRQPIIVSLGLHVFVAVLAWIGLPSIKRNLPSEQPTVVIEVVQSVRNTNLNEGDKPNTAKQVQKAAQKNKPPPPPPPPPPAAKAKPAPAKPAPKVPDLRAEILPEKVSPKPKPKPEVVQSPVPPKGKPKLKKTARQKAPNRLPQSPPKRVNKLAQKKALQKQRSQALTGVMQNLAKAKAVSKDAEKKRREKERKEVADNLTNNLTVAAGNALRAPKKSVVGPLGLSEKAIVEQHVAKFWSPPAGISNDGGLIVDIILSIDARGNVLVAEVDENFGVGSNKRRRIMVEEAIRTIYKASPLPLPLEKSELWVGKKTKFEFDPVKLLK